jgi:hypothetical protein
MGNNFMSRTPIVQQLRERIDKWDCIKLKIFCIAKETVFRLKRQPTKWGKNLCHNITDKEFKKRIYKKLKKTNLTKNQQPIE